MPAKAHRRERASFILGLAVAVSYMCMTGEGQGVGVGKGSIGHAKELRLAREGQDQAGSEP